MRNIALQSNRLVSLDFFRGITIAGMILVNNPGSWKYIYPPFKHAEWHGWTYTDTIFPFFLFIVGVAITFALSKRLEFASTKSEIYKKRHVAVDIPSTYGSYYELKFAALGLSFRVESFVNVLFEEMNENINLKLITKATFCQIYYCLKLFNTSRMV